MLKIKNVIPIICIILLIFGLISFISVSHFLSIRKINRNANKIYLSFYDEESSKKAIEEEIKKTQLYKALQANTIRHLNPNYPNEEDKEKSKKILRNLEESNLFDNVALVNPVKESFYFISRWIFERVKQFSSNIIVYPYSYDYNDNNSTNKTLHFEQGSYIALNPSELGSELGVRINQTLSIQKARALYDTDIAILSVEGTFEGKEVIDYFYDGIDWCSYFSALRKGNCYENYAAFDEAKKNNITKTYITKLDTDDLLSGKLMNGNIPIFGILIIPDFLFGVYERLKSKLKQEGFNKIRQFYDSGGVIFATGKSGVLLEDIGLVKSGTYDRNKLLFVDNYERITTSRGCEETFNKKFEKSDDDFDFEKRMACIAVYGQWIGLSTTFLTKNPDDNFKVLININPNQKDLSITDMDSFITHLIDETEKKYLPLLSIKKNAKNGQIYLMNFNPLFKGGNTNIVFNLIALAMSKELYMTSRVNLNLNNSELSDLPIPAGEVGLNLGVSTIVHNLNDEIISNCKLYAFLADNFSWVDYPKECYLSSEDIPEIVKQKKSLISKNGYLICDIGTMSAYEKHNFTFLISILNYMATQTKYQIEIVESIAVLTVSESKTITLVDYIKANSEAAPLLRPSFNGDPSSNYPVYGEGSYIDNVIKVENKEQSSALDVEYVSIIPLISPLFNGIDQRKVEYAIRLFTDYYNDNKFEVPFRSGNATDYIYTASLIGKGTILASEWDSPTLPVKELINLEKAKESKESLKKEVDIEGINFSMITITKASEIIKQINYRESNRFYKLASQRLLVYIDDTTPEGAKSLYGQNLENLPNELKDPIKKDRAKKEYIFIRNDIFFYDNENYCNPPTADDYLVFSLDKLDKYESKPDCKKNRGEGISKKIFKGYFDNFDEEHKKKIIEPDIYSNKLFDYCNLTVIDPTKEESIIKRFGDLSHIRTVHYIIPNIEENIISAEQIYNFNIDDEEGSGHHINYPLIKFIHLHSANFIINSKTCLYGGKIIINLINNYKIKSEEDITVSPDQIAVYKTEYLKTDNQIIIYFRRGLMSNEQFGVDLNLTIHIENLGSKIDEKFEMTIYEMKYDVSFPPTFERYSQVNKTIQIFKYISAFSLPALEIKSNLNRNFKGYEMMEPFTRYGIYSQEIGHRYVYSIQETHHQTKPGLTGSSKTYAYISNLGISSIPFINHVTVGVGTLIPSGTSTSRISWKDVWGRTWHQPIRSLFVDVPPLPPPLKNLMMSTTYEILKNGKQIYEWPSDENVQIHLHIKLLNNYPKYFEITRCKENEIKFIPKYLTETHSREFANSSSVKIEDNLIIRNDIFLRQGGFSSYGICYTDERAIVDGKKVIGDLKSQIELATLCADFTDENMISKCAKDLENITTLHKIGRNYDPDIIWNYSPRVESYYPKNYIDTDMWNLNKIDYDDDNMEKGYKFHNDNQLPNYDNSLIRPQNIISVPIYKGLGYSITYSKESQMTYHGRVKYGWWGDNLQNRDDTLLAGQNICNKISVDKDISIKSWINGKDLKGHNNNTNERVQNITRERNKNIYVCLFNQHRPEYNKDNKIKYESSNVNQNNVIPIIIDLEPEDPRLNNYNCSEVQFTPDNLYLMEGNLLETPTSKDYLYFSSNLRGESKEAFNVLLNLKNFDKIKYEGMVKINEGSRFVFWNPANGPNSFGVVDNPVNIINAKRNDIEISSGLFPLTISTFNSTIYHYYTFKDHKKINQIWPFDEFYTNSYGFGDVAVSVYVGGFRNSKPILEKGEYTYARIIFYNNCGFDWKMKIDAIDFDEPYKKSISAVYLEALVHTIRKPLKYNFLNYIVEDKYKQYITIEPSDHNIEVAPEFFDFENINVVTIRDGFKGEYNLKIHIKNDFPENLRGKPIEIKINLNTSYFENFPGTDTDLTGPKYHDYQVIIPSLYIAVPFNSGEFKGKVLCTSAYASNLNFLIRIGIDWQIQGIKYIDNQILDKMLNATQEDNTLEKLDYYWKELEKNKTNNIKFTEEKYSSTLKTINFTGFNEDISSFPIPNQYGPDQAEITVLVKSKVSQMQRGYAKPLNSICIFYNDWINKTKFFCDISKYIEARGAWIILTYSKTLVERLPNGTFIESPNQLLSHTEEGIIRIHFILTNNGNGDAYNTTYSISIQSNLTYLGCQGVKNIKLNYNENTKQTDLIFDLNSPIMATQSKAGYIFVKYPKFIESFNSLLGDELDGLPTFLQVANESSTSMKLTLEKIEEPVTQIIRTPIVFAYQSKKGSLPYIDLVVFGKRSNPSIEIVPKVKLENETLENIIFSIAKVDMTEYIEEKLKNMNEVYGVKYLIKNAKNVKSYNSDKPITKEVSNKKHVVLYSISIIKKDNTEAQNKFAYIQEDIGMSSFEVILIIISIILFAFSGIFIWFGINNLKLRKDSSLEMQAKYFDQDKLLNENI